MVLNASHFFLRSARPESKSLHVGKIVDFPPLHSVQRQAVCLSPPAHPTPSQSKEESFGDMGANPHNTHELDEKLIIAIDFGTTYSGIAFCFPNRRQTKVTTVLDWPDTGGASQPKIPTAIKYVPGSEDFKWGASVGTGEGIVGVKLLLDPSQERPLYLRTWNAKRDIKNLPKQPVDIAADSMRKMYRHALEQIAKEVPSQYLTLCQMHFVLTGQLGPEGIPFPRCRASC